jgi:predicted nucleotidyltransferase
MTYMAFDSYPIDPVGDPPRRSRAQAVALPGAVAAVCRQFHVRRLELVGSGARGGDFGAASDLDFVVTFEAVPQAASFGHFLALRAALAAATGRRVDLIEAGSVSNPYVRDAMARDCVRVYGA